MRNRFSNIKKYSKSQAPVYSKIDLNENFPSLVNNKIHINSNINNIKLVSKFQNYEHLINAEKNILDTDHSNNKLNIEKEFKKGWTVFDKKTKKIISNNIKDNIHITSDISVNDIYRVYNKLSDNWNKFRDEINYLYGDRSPYINYKEEINKIIEEENNIYDEMYNYHNSQISDDDYDYDNDDFYYHK